MGRLADDLNDINSWKYITFKKHNAFVCMPNIGTPWVNKLSDISSITTSSERFIISDPIGDKMGVSASYLARNYHFINGEPINADTLRNRLEDNLLDWEEIEGNAEATFWAFHLDVNKYGNACKNYQIRTDKGIVLANRTGINHGVGDFLICPDKYGRPDLNKVSVINGRLFVVMFNLNRFQGLVTHNETVLRAKRPATIFTPEKYKNIQERKVMESKKEIASQLEQCYDVLGLAASSLLLVYYVNYLIKLSNSNMDIVNGLLLNSNLEGSIITTNASKTVSAYGTSLLSFSSGTKLYLRVAISVDNKIVCNLQLEDKNNAVVNSMLSNNTELCKAFIFFVKTYKSDVEDLVQNSMYDLKNRQGYLLHIVSSLISSLDNKILESYMKSGESSFARCMTAVINDFR